LSITRQPWLIALIAGIAIITWYSVLVTEPVAVLLQIGVILTFGVLLPIFFAVLRLDTDVSVDGISYRMPPIMRKERIISRNDLEAADQITIARSATAEGGAYGTAGGRGSSIFVLIS